ncbi:MAG: family 16 glycosylhydrolase, partial [Luteolibacter sp.]
GAFVSGTSLRFGTTSAGLTSTQLASISAPGFSSFSLSPTGYLTDSSGLIGYASWSGGAAFTADTNNDGVTNGMAWVLGASNPAANVIGLQPTIDSTTDPEFFIYTYRRSDAAFTAPGTTIAVEYSSDLNGWTTAVAGPNIIITSTDDFYSSSPGVDRVIVKIRKTLTVGDTTGPFTLPGTYVLRLTATDGELEVASDEITVTVTDTYAAWSARAGIFAFAPSDDSDGDGVANILEYALGSDASQSSMSILPVASVVGGKLALTFNRIADPALTYEVLASPDLAGWQSIWSSSGAQNTLGPVTVADSLSASSTRRFLRVRVTFGSQLAPGIDLVVTDVRVIRPDVVAGDYVSFEVTVRNQGATALPSTWFGVSLDINGSYATWGGGTYSLAAGASLKITTAGWTATGGAFNVTAGADYSKSVTESDETNNRATFSYVSPAPVYQSTPAAGAWNLNWSDEFTGSGAPDPAKWVQEVGFQRNGELQYYTLNRSQNLRRENGVLIIEACREDYPVAGLPNSYGATTASYTSGSLITKGKASWTYGRIDVAAKVATALGTWSCIWTLGDNYLTAGWPRCGEIDLMESVGWESAITHHSIHTQASNNLTGNGYTVPTRVPNLASAFIIYSIEWDAQSVRFFTDGRRVAEYDNDGTGEASWPFFRNQYLLLNLAVGGTWGRVGGIAAAAFPQRMQIDYVRVYQK